MPKKLYLYKALDVCDPLDVNAYHKDGGLAVVTSGYPNDAVPRGTGNRFEVCKGGESNDLWGLPEPDLVVVVPESTADTVIAFPNAGCC